MIKRNFLLSCLLFLILTFTSNAFISKGNTFRQHMNNFLSSLDIQELNLTPVLLEYAEGLKNVVDDKLRYQQLLFLAAKSQPMPDALKIDENKVPGCLSVVHVHATMDENEKISFLGDSDSQLTKGLVAMLVNGLSGHTVDEIEAVKPEFIQYAGVAKSLTPGRNNGFLNMLNLMKRKSRALAASHSNDTPDQVSVFKENSGESSVEGGPVYQSIMKKLTMLQPVELVVEDESHKHAGHQGMKELNSASGETHFNVRVVASCFEGLSKVQRHQMIYTLLAKELKEGVHALSMETKTPSE